MKTIRKIGLLALICLSAIRGIAQPRFIAFNVYQLSAVTVSSATQSKQTAMNSPLTFTGIGVGPDAFMWADCGLVANVLAALSGRKKDYAPANAAGYKATDLGLISFTLGKQVKTEDKYTLGFGVDCDIRAFGGMPAPMGPLLFTLGPAVCGQYRPNNIFTFVTLLGGGASFGGRQIKPIDGAGVLWRNYVSVGYGKVGLNIGPELHFFNVKDSREVKWTSITTSIQLGLSFRLE